MTMSVKKIVQGVLIFSLASIWAMAQKDPGVRGGPAGGGQPLPGLQVNEGKLFEEGKFRATELESTCDKCSEFVPGSPTGDNPVLAVHTNSAGLGARFNADQCAACHNQPAVGGSGGFMVPNPQDPQHPLPPENPQFRLIPHRFGQTNEVPSFETQFGPIREVRFRFKPDGTRDGGVHQLWTVVGRQDDPTIPNCRISQPDFDVEFAKGNLTFRIPTQLFGLGIIDSIQDQEILKHFAATAAQRQNFGIQGRPNHSGNDGTITRFGWKAQNKSISIFSGEAYNVEMGVTNEAFPQAVEENEACNGPNKPHPNDVVRVATNDATNDGFDNPLHIMPDWSMFMLFMRFLDAPQPAAFSPSAQRGREVFATVGCALCHTPAMQTAPVMNSAALQAKTANLYSDLLLHHMGANLDDEIIQGEAGPDEFRSAPLWGVGQRIFFLHDGRTNNLLEAIDQHFSAPTTKFPNGSEANKSVQAFNALSVAQKQDLLNFLRAL